MSESWMERVTINNVARGGSSMGVDFWLARDIAMRLDACENCLIDAEVERDMAKAEIERLTGGEE